MAAPLHYLPPDHRPCGRDSRSTASVELTEAMLQRIDALNPKLNALRRSPQIWRSSGRSRPRQKSRKTRYRGPLHGLIGRNEGVVRRVHEVEMRLDPIEVCCR